MNTEQLKEIWKKEEDIAHIHGWDFSHIHGRYTEEDDLPWDFREVIQKYRKDSMKLMDMETGGGEFLLSLHHPNESTAAIEGYPPNVKLCKEVLLPLGIDFRAAGGCDRLPFSDGSFDIITNRHGDYDAAELRRVLKPNGLFLTQQVGAENDRELVQLLLPHISEYPIPNNTLSREKQNFLNTALKCWRAEKPDGQSVSLTLVLLSGLQGSLSGSSPVFLLKAVLNNCTRRRKSLK